MPPRTDTKLTGSAGEHYVCSMLARFDWAASLTRDGLERTDILAVHTIRRDMIEVQVKTIRSGDRWMLGRKGLQYDRSGREWYVFVRFGTPLELPECYVVPRDHVAAATWIEHQAWLHDDSVPADRRNAPVDQSRVSSRAWTNYRDAWEQLGADPREVPVRLPQNMREDMVSVGLPDDHPWNRQHTHAWSRPMPEWVTSP